MPLLKRAPDSNKASHGAVAVVGGATGTVGAAFLSGRAALFSGAGRVYVVRPNLHDGLVMDAMHPELMVIDFAQSKTKPITTWCIGPGLGESDSAHQILKEVLAMQAPVVIDADGLNLMAEDPALMRQCARRTQPTVITPHPGEAARLLHQSVAEIQANREAAAQQLCESLQSTVLLKGMHTVIQIAGQPPAVNNTGNPALATAGTGDVLTGLLGALIAQGMRADLAAMTAVQIHGTAAEHLSQRLGGVIGRTAGELIPEIRRLLNQ
jgi:hydroxyethylthiazole kinase-like uncharacterized protein yjeF